MLNGLSREIVTGFLYYLFRVSTESIVPTKATLEEVGWPLFPEVAWGMSSRGSDIPSTPFANLVGKTEFYTMVSVHSSK